MSPVNTTDDGVAVMPATMAVPLAKKNRGMTRIVFVYRGAASTAYVNTYLEALLPLLYLVTSPNTAEGAFVKVTTLQHAVSKVRAVLNTVWYVTPQAPAASM